MKKIKFTLATYRLNSEVSKIIEIKDDITDEEIREMYEQWVLENNYGGYRTL